MQGVLIHLKKCRDPRKNGLFARHFRVIIIALALITGFCLFSSPSLLAASLSDQSLDRPVVLKTWLSRWATKPLTIENFQSMVEIGDQSFQPIKSTNLRTHDPDQMLWLSTTLPDHRFEHPTLYIPAVQESFRLWIGASLLYEWGDMKGLHPTRSYGESWHLVPLPPISAGQKLLFEIRSPYSQIGILPSVTFGSNQDLIPTMFERQRLPLAIALLSMILGIFSLLYFAFKKISRVAVSFGFFMLSTGFYLFCTTKLNYFFYPDPHFWGLANPLSIMIAPVFFFAFFQRIFRKSAWPLLKFCIPLHLIIFAGTILSLVFSLVHIKVCQAYFNSCLIGSICLHFIFVIRQGIKGDHYAKIFCTGVGLLSFFSLGEIFRGLGFNILPISMHWGLLGMGAAVTWILIIEGKNEEKQAMLRKQGLERARMVQETLLPSTINIPGVSLAHHYEAAEETGGDLFDLFYDEKRQRLFLFMADVSGHGVSAALMTGVLSGTFKSLILELKDWETSNGELLRRLAERVNQVIQHTGSRTGYHVTLSLVAIDLLSGELHHISAGHTPLLLLRGGHIRYIPNQGSPIGIMAEPAYDFVAYQLEQEDCLILFTDGLLENEGPTGEKFHMGRLRRLLMSLSGAPETIRQGILFKAQEIWQQQKAKDDCTFLILRFATRENADDKLQYPPPAGLTSTLKALNAAE